MLLDQTIARNRGLIEAAFSLHQDGVIPPGTKLIDLDAVAENARAMGVVARRLGLRVYIMTKQDGHNPHLAAAALAQRLDGLVAVEAMAAHRIHRYELPLAHVGHLANIPSHQVSGILDMEPRVITVYTQEMARAVSDAAGERDRVQDVYLRVSNPDEDGIARGIAGGWTEAECVAGARRILALPNVRVVGLTQHSCIDLCERDPLTARPTSAFFTMLRAKDALERELGLVDLRINCAGNTNVLNFETLARYGATDVEPGRALTGSAYFHALREMPERPAQVFVSEVGHRWDNDLYIFGGGFMYLETFRGELQPYRALIGRSLEEAHASAELLYRSAADYYGTCSDDPRARPGDTVVMAMHSQAFLERGYVAGVSGISRGAPKLEGLFDSACHALDECFQPRPLREVIESVAYVRKLYESLDRGTDSAEATV